MTSPGSDNDLSSHWEEVRSLDSVRKASVTFQTPKRLKMGNMLSQENVRVMTKTRGSPLADVFPLGPDDSGLTQSDMVEQALGKIFGDWNKIESNFQTRHAKLLIVESRQYKGLVPFWLPATTASLLVW
jgi:hypothetical protein